MGAGDILLMRLMDKRLSYFCLLSGFWAWLSVAEDCCSMAGI
jgi:hypothetical protein